QAAQLSHDPDVERMAGWTSAFENQREQFAADRHKQYDKYAGDVQLLLKRGKSDYAIERARDACLLADDKKAFRAEPWVDELVRDAIKRADQYDRNEQWINSLRIYSDLTTIEPTTAMWRDRLKLVTRRVRLLALYTPEVLKTLQDSDVKERDEVEQLLNPTTQPATKKSEPADNDSFKIDWHE